MLIHVLYVFIRYLSELCCVDGIAGVGRATFPMVRSTHSSDRHNSFEFEDVVFSSEVL